MAPFSFSPATANVVAALIGFCFGFVLERGGFGNARNLAAQFYLYNMRVLKVMFTAIITAMVLICLTSALGLLDFELLYVPPTHLWPGVLGGLILGVGFIVGGYCPGTSLVSMATLKTDGTIFVIGVVAGSLLFGPIVAIPAVWNFWNNSGALGRLTWSDVLGIDAGWIVLAVLVMAFGAFAAAEVCERIFSRPSERPTALAPRARLARRAGVGLAIGMALAAIAAGQPTIDRRVDWQRESLDARLASREVHIDPGELLDLMHNNQIQLVLVDVRDESDFNQFHLADARNITLEDLAAGEPKEIDPKEIFVVMSNDEARAEQAWRRLAVRRGANAYVLAGGLNRWLDVFADNKANLPGPDSPVAGDDTPRHSFDGALGARHAASRPSPQRIAERPFQSKVKVLTPVKAPGGGCG